MGRSVPKGAASGALKNHYPGGFEATMSRSEAALILGVRRTASIKKIKVARSGCVGASLY
jgi:hypothetical protein